MELKSEVWMSYLTMKSTMLRALWLACSGAWLVSLLTMLGEFPVKIGGMTASTVIYIVTSRLIAIQLANNKKNIKLIGFHGDILSIPRVFRAPLSIELSDVKSVEVLELFKRPSAVVLGRHYRSNVIIEKRTFVREDDFAEFLTVLAQRFEKNRSVGSLKNAGTLCQRNGAMWHIASLVPAAILIAVYFITTVTNASEPNVCYIAKGALTKTTFQSNELYRIFSASCLHISALHLMFNIIGLSILGRVVEIVMGRVRFACLLLLSVIGGAILSVAFAKYNMVIGASGGVSGLFAAFIIISFKYPDDLPPSLTAGRYQIALILFVQILFDLISPGVDFLSHLGGFACGALYTGWIVKGSAADALARVRFWELVAALILFTLFISSLTHYLTLISGRA